MPTRSNQSHKLPFQLPFLLMRKEHPFWAAPAYAFGCQQLFCLIGIGASDLGFS